MISIAMSGGTVVRRRAPLRRGYWQEDSDIGFAASSRADCVLVLRRRDLPAAIAEPRHETPDQPCDCRLVSAVPHFLVLEPTVDELSGHISWKLRPLLESEVRRC